MGLQTDSVGFFARPLDVRDGGAVQAVPRALLEHALGGGLAGGDACDGHAEGAARDVVEPERVEEAHRFWLAAVLAADPHLVLCANTQV